MASGNFTPHLAGSNEPHHLTIFTFRRPSPRNLRWQLVCCEREGFHRTNELLDAIHGATSRCANSDSWILRPSFHSQTGRVDDPVGGPGMRKRVERWKSDAQCVARSIIGKMVMWWVAESSWRRCIWHLPTCSQAKRWESGVRLPSEFIFCKSTLRFCLRAFGQFETIQRSKFTAQFNWLNS